MKLTEIGVKWLSKSQISSGAVKGVCVRERDLHGGRAAGLVTSISLLC